MNDDLKKFKTHDMEEVRGKKFDLLNKGLREGASGENPTLIQPGEFRHYDNGKEGHVILWRPAR